MLRRLGRLQKRGHALQCSGWDPCSSVLVALECLSLSDTVFAIITSITMVSLHHSTDRQYWRYFIYAYVPG